MNFGNIGTMMKLQSALKTFNANHPRVMPFFKAVGAEGVTDGMVIDMTVRTPEGKSMTSNIKVQQSDLELIETLKNLNMNE